MPFLVNISGATCTGKSTLGYQLAEQTGTILVPEPNMSDRLLKTIDGNGESIAAIQNALVRERYRSIKESLDSINPSGIIFIDRSLNEDRDVFFRLHYHTSSISIYEYNHLTALVDDLLDDIPDTNLTIFLSSDRAVLESRISKRPEGDWLLKNLHIQLALYDEYRMRLERSHGQVLDINTSESITEWSGLCWKVINTALRDKS